MIYKYLQNRFGFTFIEMALVLIVVGVIAGAGLLLFGRTIGSAQRRETVEQLQQTKKALLLVAEAQGRLPEGRAVGDIYYHQRVGSSPLDVWGGPVIYRVSGNVSTTTLTQYVVCKQARLPGGPGWIALNDLINETNYVADVTGGEAAVVALLLSGGARVLSDDNTVSPYIRNYPSENFDDIVVAITADELYGAIRDNFCTATVTVEDNRGVGGIYYVYDVSIGRDVGSANGGGNSVIARVPFDDVVVIRDVPDTVPYVVGTALNSDAPPAIIANTTITLPFVP